MNFSIKNIVLFFILLLSNLTFSQCDWQNVGTDNFNEFGYNGGGHAVMSLDNNDIPYVLISDSGHNLKATVYRYTNSKWEIVGLPGFSSGNVSSTFIEFDSNNKPYVAFADSGITTIMKYNSTSWVNVPPPNQTINKYLMDFKIGSNDTLYLSTSSLIYGVPPILLKYDGSNWISLGNIPQSSYPYTPTLAIDKSGNVYAAFVDSSYQGYLSVMKFDGINWSYVGTPGFSNNWPSDRFSIDTDSSGLPYVAFADFNFGAKATVMKYDGVNWVNVGNPGFSSKIVFQIKIVVDKNNNDPSISLRNGMGQNSIMRYSNTNWTTKDLYYLKTVGLDINIGKNSLLYALGENAVYRNNNVSWETLGDTNLVCYGHRTCYIRIGTDNTPYVLSNTGVVKFNDSCWVQLGRKGFPVNGTSIAMDTNNLPVVATTEITTVFTGGVTSYTYSKIILLKYNGTKWDTIGPPFSSAGSLSYYSPARLLIDSNNIPYVTFRDPDINFKARVIKLTNNVWSDVGSVGISSGKVYYHVIYIDSFGNLFIAYSEIVAYQSGPLTVKKYDGTNWINIGNPGFSPNASEVSLTADGNGVPYVFFKNGSNNNKASVMKFNGSSWEFVGINIISQSYINNPIIKINSNGSPIISYEENEKINVVKFDGLDWIYDKNISSVPTNNLPDMTIDKNNQIYVVYNALTDDNTHKAGTYVKKSECNTPEIFQKNYFCSDLVLYPNPSTGILFLKNDIKIKNVSVYSLLGQLVYEETVNKILHSINLSNQSKGIYILKLTDDNGNVCKEKIIKN